MVQGIEAEDRYARMRFACWRAAGRRFRNMVFLVASGQEVTGGRRQRPSWVVVGILLVNRRIGHHSVQEIGIIPTQDTREMGLHVHSCAGNVLMLDHVHRAGL